MGPRVASTLTLKNSRKHFLPLLSSFSSSSLACSLSPRYPASETPFLPVLLLPAHRAREPEPRQGSSKVKRTDFRSRGRGWGFGELASALGPRPRGSGCPGRCVCWVAGGLQPPSEPGGLASWVGGVARASSPPPPERRSAGGKRPVAGPSRYPCTTTLASPLKAQRPRGKLTQIKRPRRAGPHSRGR